MKKLLHSSLIILLALFACRPEEPLVPVTPDTPAPVTIVATSESVHQNIVCVEALFSDSTKMYFNLLSDSTAETTHYHSFYHDAQPSQKWIYQGEVAIPQKFTHKGKNYKVVGIGDWTFGGGLGYADFSHVDDAATMQSVEIPHSVTYIGERAFQSCKQLVSIEIPNSVTTIGYCAFMGCTALASIEIPNSVTEIINSCFTHCQALASVKLPNSIVTICDNAFETCVSLQSFEIPRSVYFLGMEVFKGCDSLRTLYCLPSTPPYQTVSASLNQTSFTFPESLETIYVQAHSVDWYKTDKHWRPYADIIIAMPE